MPTPPIGIFARTFPGSNADTILAAVAQSGYDTCQFNLLCAGLDTVPAVIPDGIADEVMRASRQHSVSIAALSGTCHLAASDRATRHEWVRRLTHLARFAADIGCPVLTLSTGTRHPTDLWAAHPDNATPAAWADARESLTALAAATAHLPVRLAFEPEAANIVTDAPAARRMLDQIGAPNLAVVLDLANLVTPRHENAAVRRLSADAAALLSDRIALIHAKDVSPDGSVVPAGTGRIDFSHYLGTTLEHTGRATPVVTHGLSPADAPAVRQHLIRALA